MTNEELFALLKKNPVSVGCGALSLALAAGIYFRGGVLPDHEAELAQKSAEGKRLAANVKYAAQLKEQLAAVVQANKEIERRLVRGSQIAINQQYFYKLEAETGTKVTIQQSPISPVRGGVKTVFASVPFSATVAGSYSQLVDFLLRLEGQAHYCRVTSASCSVPLTARNSAMSLTISLELLGLP
ncbi:MAG: hypothetical protein EXS32_05360 [Opitutus sp.]|nr:hypothetical protein [Opitutus sp.]